jgi:hypothetical protein
LRGGENMKKFKAVVTFAYLENVYYKDDETYEAPAELVDQWAEVGYVEPVEEPKAKKKGAAK